jgi:predicted transcriptional regulator
MHQMNVLGVIVTGNEGAPEDQHADLDQVLERISRETTKSSLQFTIRALIANGMIEKLPQVHRRGRMRAVFRATDLGKMVGGVRGQSSIVEPEVIGADLV